MDNLTISNYSQSCFLPNIFNNLNEDLLLKIFLDSGASSLQLSETSILNRKFFITKELSPYQIACKSFEIASSLEIDKFSAQVKAIKAVAHCNPFKALELTYSLQDKIFQAEALAYVAGKIALFDLKTAFEVAYSLEEENYRDSVLAAIAEAIAPHNLGEALGIVESIKDERRKSFALAGVVKSIANTQIERALELADSIPEIQYKMQALENVLRVLAESNVNALVLHFEQILKMITSLEIPNINKMGSLAFFAEAIKEVYTEGALKILDHLDFRKRLILHSIIECATLTHKQKILETIQAIGNVDERTEALVKFVDAIALIDPEEALVLCDLILGVLDKSAALSRVFKVLAEQNLERAFELLEINEEEEIKDFIRVSIVKVLARNKLEEAEEIASTIVSNVRRAEAFGYIAKAIAVIDLDKALKYVDLSETDFQKATVLKKIMQSIAKTNSKKAQEIGHSVERYMLCDDPMLSIAKIIAEDDPEAALEFVETEIKETYSKQITIMHIEKVIIKHYPEKVVKLVKFAKDKFALTLAIEDKIKELAKSNTLGALKVANAIEPLWLRVELLSLIAIECPKTNWLEIPRI